jgi:hypothetical protein
VALAGADLAVVIATCPRDRVKRGRPFTAWPFEDVVVDGALLALAVIVFSLAGSQTTRSASRPTITAPLRGSSPGSWRCWCS